MDGRLHEEHVVALRRRRPERVGQDAQGARVEARSRARPERREPGTDRELERLEQRARAARQAPRVRRVVREDHAVPGQELEAREVERTATELLEVVLEAPVAL